MRDRESDAGPSEGAAKGESVGGRRSWAERLMALPQDQGPGSPRRRILFFFVSGALVVGILWLFREVLLPFLFAVVLAYVLAPVVRLLERGMPRWAAVLTLYSGLLLALTAFVWVGIPRLAVEVEKLARETPNAVRVAQQDWLPALEREFRAAMESYGGVTVPEAVPSPEFASPPAASSIAVLPEGDGFRLQLPEEGLRVEQKSDGEWVIAPRPEAEQGTDLTQGLREAFARQIQNTEEHTVTLLKTAQAVATKLVRGVFTFFIMLMISAYLLATSERIFTFMKSLVHSSRQRQFDRLLKRIDRGLSGVVRGQLLIALVNGILSGIGFYLFDLPYWPILTVIATVLSIIPIFGAIISSVPAVIVGLQGGVMTALGVLAWIIVIHQIEANLLNPKIMGDSAKVHPVLVVFALLGGEHLFGIAGALLAVPILSILQSLFLHYREVALGVPGPKRGTTSAPPEAASAPEAAST